MRASVGQSAAWAALAGHIGACFQPRCLRTARHPRASGTAESLQRGRGSRLSHRRSAAAATGQATGPVTAQFSTLNEMPPVTQLMSSHGRSGPCFESHLPAPYFLLSPPYSICTRPAPSHKAYTLCVLGFKRGSVGRGDPNPKETKSSSPRAAGRSLVEEKITQASSDQGSAHFYTPSCKHQLVSSRKTGPRSATAPSRAFSESTLQPHLF